MNSFFKYSALALILTSCAPMIDTHGDALDPEKIAALKPGQTDYTEVLQILGSPSSKTMFDTENWLYIMSKQERVAFAQPTEIERVVTVLKFNRNGVLQEIEVKELADGRKLQPSTEKTPTYGKELTVLDQMIGNVGRFAGSSQKR